MILNEDRSSLIAEVDYDAVKQSLKIKFRTTNTTYTYFDVPQNLIVEMLNAESVGSYFSKNIKNRFQYEKR